MTDRPGARRDDPVVSGAQERLAARVATSRKARRQRALLFVSGTMSALVLLVAGSAWGLAGYVNDTVHRVDAGTAGAPASGPLNILVAGVDQRSGLTTHEQYVLHVGHDVSSNSDTMMLVHVSASRSSVTVVSLPRDSWVTIPGHGMNKINAAYGIGGPKLVVQTVEQATGLAVNDYVQVNFLAFVKVIDALGGVNICLPYAVDDLYSGLNLSAGRHHVNGITALEYARDRHSFATSDLQRIKDQQELVSSALSEAISAGTLANPLRFSSFLSAVLGAVKVDSNLNVTALADEMRGISARNVTFVTVPLATMNYQAPNGESAVLWNSQAAGQLFGDLASDRSPVASQSSAPHASSGGHGSGSSGSSGSGSGGSGSGGSGSGSSGSSGAGSGGSGGSAAGSGAVTGNSASQDACR